MVLTAGFYCDSRAHNVGKVRLVKYIVVYGQIKVADQKYCHNQRCSNFLGKSRTIIYNDVNATRAVIGRCP